MNLSSLAPPCSRIFLVQGGANCLPCSEWLLRGLLASYLPSWFFPSSRWKIPQWEWNWQPLHSEMGTSPLSPSSLGSFWTLLRQVIHSDAFLNINQFFFVVYEDFRQCWVFKQKIVLHKVWRICNQGNYRFNCCKLRNCLALARRQSSCSLYGIRRLQSMNRGLASLQPPFSNNFFLGLPNTSKFVKHEIWDCIQARKLEDGAPLHAWTQRY